MPRRNRSTQSSNNGSTYVKLEERLVLLAWLNSLFGYKSNKEMLTDLKDTGEGFDPEGRSFIYHHLVGRGDKLRIPVEKLEMYDENIRKHLATINQGRIKPVTLRYFQYLALLYTEIFLDWRFNHPVELLSQLNAFVVARNNAKAPGEQPDPLFTEEDLNKVAFWMATGSGKTLIMHFNYYQFLHYNRKPLDNIILITPNEGLTEQHMAEMDASNIPYERVSYQGNGFSQQGHNIVKVIEITKLVEEKKGGGVRVPVESFQGNKLIFVDEGHKGTGGEAWRKVRDELGQTGFTFEYSATFGQALTATRDDELTAEYGKAIIFDYSYRYFYGDGYGKDFHIINLGEEVTGNDTDILLLGNLLSFYEQQRCFAEQSEDLRPYNLEKPLWVFVCSSVNGVYTENKKKRSDVLTVARFLHRFLINKEDWAVNTIGELIQGNSGLVNKEGKDLFADRFAYLRSVNTEPQAIYQDMLATVFHAQASGGLHICDLRGQEGELGLKVSGAGEYFGLIYIGETSEFKKLVNKDNSGITVEEDVISESLFATINRPDTTINILIGAKKFIEGWNSWRVSNMGLLNIGRSEGSQIIQLFGRGVRLRGRDFSLKRSSALDGEHPQHLRLLETLNIFAVRANYMAQFREYLEREGVETEGHIELPLAIRPNRNFLNKELLMPKLPEGKSFREECWLLLAPDPAVKVTVDMSLKVEAIRSLEDGIATISIRAGQEQVIPSASLNLVDWQAVYLELMKFKEQKGFSNLILRPETPRQLIEFNEPRLYKLLANETVVKPKSFEQILLLQEAVLSILRKYIEKYYRVYQERWETQNMIYDFLDECHPNFQDYTVKISRKERQLIAAVKKLIDEGQRIYEKDTEELPNIYFDRHLYQPLLIERDDRIKTVPPGLKESERRFVDDLRKYVLREAGGKLATKEIFLLRNLSRGKGIGFFENEGFFPDFILWIKEGSSQRIVFIEPHGMIHEKAYWTNDKIRLHERLRELSQEWGEKNGLKDVELDSFIISATPYEVLRMYYGENWTRKEFAERHILFFDESGNVDYLGALFAVNDNLLNHATK
ncbi:DEAD/DEAH box helicase family protein [Moorella sulfitireducens]|uniref:DEAD/DEAH box helicase family protein n=1 Tax=Neomoorella sulfitireducens TaxID=2972948 RepID=UPI0021AC9004|nr:DEAD/DEAH box helicase family protein [Moorella sulfitireducens]